MPKFKNNAKLRRKHFKLPQAGIIYGTKTVRSSSCSSTSSEAAAESVFDHLFIDKNPIISKNRLNINQNSMLVHRGSLLNSENNSKINNKLNNSDKNDTFSAETEINKDKISEKTLKLNKKVKKVNNLLKLSKIDGEKSIIINERWRNNQKNFEEKSINKREKDDLIRKNEVLNGKKSIKLLNGDLKKENRLKNGEKSINKRGKDDLSGKSEVLNGKKSIKLLNDDLGKENRLKNEEKSINKRGKDYFIGKSKVLNGKKSIKLLNDDLRKENRLKNEEKSVKEGKMYGFEGGKSVTEEAEEECSESESPLYEQREEDELLWRYKEQSVELSKLRVKFNEVSLENNSRRQLLESVSSEVNDLRYENCSVKTRNETLAATSVENQNLSRIIDSLNRKISELNEEIENFQQKTAENSRKILELTKSFRDCREKESSTTIELEHLRKQLLEKENEMRKMVTHQKVDENKDFQIKMIHNELVELRGNIRVICRIKPESNNCIQILDNETLQLPPLKSKMICPTFNFNRVFRPNSSQSDLFMEVKQLVNSFVDGYNVSLITYGQSGSGKTHTMIGSKDDPGIVTHSIREIFRLCKQRSTWTYRICLSVLEIYNETIFDLLSTDQSIKPLWKKRTQIHDDGKCIHIKGLSEIEIKHEEELVHFINRSGKGRSSCITSQNCDSSRSHFIVMLRIYGKNTFLNSLSQGVLMLCDLAGSENCTSTLCNDSLTESKYISKSLTVLGRVFEALYNKLTVIPFRDSKLSHILKPSLSGDAKFALIVTVSGKMENINNSLRALNLAKKVAQISLGQPRRNTCIVSKPLSKAELLCQSN